MKSFRVTNVVDGDTFEVSPNWKWNDQTGCRVRPTGYDTPEEGQYGFEAAKRKLAGLILGKNVQLGSAYKVDRGRLVCDIYLNGHNLAAYFPEYQLGRVR